MTKTFTLLLLLTTLNGLSQKITLKPEMVINESAWGDAGLLVDEQELSGDPLNGSGGTPENTWFIDYTSWKYPASAVIDLGGVYQITNLALFDGNGTGNLEVSGGTPFDWTSYFTYGMDSYLKWKVYAIDSPTRYIRIKFDEAQACPREIVLYGELIKSITENEPPVERQKPTIDKLIGVNGFVDDPVEVLKVAGHVREYHNWNWNEGNEGFGDPSTSTYLKYPDNAIKFSPSYPGWWFDNYYEHNITDSLEIFPCIQNSVSWLTKQRAGKPVEEGADPLLPESYKEHAHFMFQYAARYGSKTVADNLLTLDASQERVSGLNYLKYFENWNEQDKWWEGREPNFTPYEFAAMSSADYDGHMGSMGDHFGVKTADPDAKMVMGGLAGLKLEYIKSMRLWSQYHREGSFPADVLNFHNYSHDADQNGGIQLKGISPEEDNIEEKLRKLVSYRDKYLPQKEIWFTEFGYDTDPGSVQRAPVIDTLSTEEVQGMWLIRYFLASAAAGVDRATMYMIRDTPGGGSSKYATSGLTTSKMDGHKPKKSWYYVYTLKNTLKGYRFKEKVSTGRPDIKVYTFENKDSEKAWVIWCPTSENKVVTDFELPVETEKSTLKLIKLKNGSTTGESEAVELINNKATLEVSEKPVFLLENGLTVTNLNKLSEKNILVAPTVFSESLNISVPTECEAEILNTQGKSVKKSHLNSGKNLINLKNLYPGAYFIGIYSENRRITKKVFKF